MSDSNYESTTVAFLGPKGTFSHRAAEGVFGESVLLKPCTNFPDIISSVEKGESPFAILPLENNTAGVVDTAIDAFIQSSLTINAEYSLKVEHALLSAELHFKDIERVYSMSQPYQQSKKFVNSHLSHCQWVQTSSSVLAIEQCLSNPEKSAAIGFKDTGKKKGLGVLHSNIQDLEENTTRFIVLSSQEKMIKSHLKVVKWSASIVFTLDDQPGALLKVLGVFDQKNLNMCHIESRPTRRKEWRHYFYITLLSPKDDREALKKALKEVSEKTPWSRHLGVYPLLK